jgi:hypothetical protein
MKNPFSSVKDERATTFVAQQPEMLELSDQELEQASGGCGQHRHWHREYRRERRGHEIVVVIIEEYY